MSFELFSPSASCKNYGATITTGGFHVPSEIEGGVVFGQYKRRVRTKGPSGAGNQLASLSFPGESCLKYSVSDPSALYFVIANLECIIPSFLDDS